MWHNAIFCWHSYISHTQTHTYTQWYTTNSGASRLTQPYKYTFTAPVMCSQQPSLLRCMNKSQISKIYFPQCLFFSKIIHLQKSYLLIRCYNTRFFLWNITNTDRNSVKNKTHTHTPNTQRKITLERVG